MAHNYYIYVIGFNLLAINYLHMKILKVFEKKLRNNNYSVNTINNYVSCINMFMDLNDTKDPYNITTRGIVNFIVKKCCFICLNNLKK